MNLRLCIVTIMLFVAATPLLAMQEEIVDISWQAEEYLNEIRNIADNPKLSARSKQIHLDFYTQKAMYKNVNVQQELVEIIKIELFDTEIYPNPMLYQNTIERILALLQENLKKIQEIDEKKALSPKLTQLIEQGNNPNGLVDVIDQLCHLYGNNRIIINLLTKALGTKSLLDIKDGGGDTPLHSAARTNNARVAHILLMAAWAYRASFIAKANNDGNTALHSAAFYNKVDSFRAIISVFRALPKDNSHRRMARRAIYTPNRYDMTPLDLAKRGNFTEIIQILECPNF